MRVVVIGGTRFIGRRIVESLHERGDEVLVVHRSASHPENWVSVQHLYCSRSDISDHHSEVDAFKPDVVVDAYALTAADVESVLPVVSDTPAVVLSSQDVYRAAKSLSSGELSDSVPIDEQSPLRTSRYPYKGLGLPGIPEAYDKIDVEERWAQRGALVLRLPMVYGAYDYQVREDFVLRRVRNGRNRMPVGSGNLLWTRCHVDDVASAVVAATDVADATHEVINIGETKTITMLGWAQQIIAASESELELVRVSDTALPSSLALLGSTAQHLLVASDKARRILGWNASTPEKRVEQSTVWHLRNPKVVTPWTEEDASADDSALKEATL